MWTIIRIALGSAQIVGVVFSVALIIKTGINELTLTLTLFTCALTTLSVLLFGSRMPKKSGRQGS